MTDAEEIHEPGRQWRVEKAAKLIRQQREAAEAGEIDPKQAELTREHLSWLSDDERNEAERLANEVDS